MSQNQSLYACPKPSLKKKEKAKVSKETKVHVYTRDNGRCVVCGKPVNYKAPHHIDYRSEDKTTIDDPDNQAMLGEAPFDLCDCHTQVHHGSIKVVIERFIEFHGLKKSLQYLLKGVIS